MANTIANHSKKGGSHLETRNKKFFGVNILFFSVAGVEVGGLGWG
jgi:hypothetical protein